MGEVAASKEREVEAEVKEEVWRRLDSWASNILDWKGLSGPSKVLVAVAWTAYIVLFPFVFIWASNTYFGLDLPLTLWMPMSVGGVIITVAGLAARQVGLEIRRDAHLRGNA